ncbi:MAG: GGDEF domain-containing protein, partial [Oceanospirillum sp.]|nr:GGDEF domain-containing protein [Oceanospirillum sp.]
LDCIISTTSNGRIVDFNPAAEAFFGYSKEQAQARIKIEHLLPDYSQLVYRTLVQKHLQKNGLSPRHETLAIDRQGDKYTVSLAISQLESDGELITTAMLHDISERKRYEDELRLASTVFNFCNEGIIISDENNVIQAVNPSFSHITGFKAEDVVGRNPNILNSSTHDEAFYEQMWQNINDKGRWQGEVINKRKDGRTYSEWLSICAVGDSDSNKAKNYVAIFSDISKRKAAEEKIWWQAHYDALTQLPNRAMFMAELHKKIDADQPLSLLFIDLDGFKAVNDTLGHNSGDDVLRCVAQRLKNALPGDSLIARLGGDEFTIILNGQSQPEDLHTLSRSLIDKLSAPYELDGDNARLSASIGIARYPDNGIDIDELINLADKMMYEVKTQGKSDVRIA